MTNTGPRPDGPQTGLTRFLEQMHRLDIKAAFALTGILHIIAESPPAIEGGLPDFERKLAMADGTLSEEDLSAAEQSIATGQFHVDLLATFLIALANSLNDAQARDRLSISQEQLDALYETGHLIARSLGGDSATPAWEFDASSPDGLLPNLDEVLTADAPEFFWSFGDNIYEPQVALRATAATAPAQWLSEGLPPDRVLAILRRVHPTDVDGDGA